MKLDTHTLTTFSLLGAFFVVLTAFSSGLTPVPSVTPKVKVWDKCKNDGDCVLFYDHCGAPKGVSKRLLDEYKNYIERVSAIMSCRGLVATGWPEDPKQIAVKCVDSRCMPRRTDVLSKPPQKKSE